MMDSGQTGKAPRQRGYWVAPKLSRDSEGGSLLLGPLQFNWYGKGWRVYLTWPGRTRTLLLRPRYRKQKRVERIIGSKR